MTETLKKTVITLIKSALCDTRAELSKDTDLEALYQFSLRQNLTPLVYYGLVRSGFSKDHPMMLKFFFTTCQFIALAEQQDAQMERNFLAFEEKGIDYLPLKGAQLRSLYPKGEMRAMSDIDILIREKQYPEIKEIMENLGFSFEKESNHEYVWSFGKTYIELHKYLIPSYNKDYYAYFGSGWERAIKVEGKSRFEMSVEDELVYLFTHFTKHYRDAGIGVRHLLDIKQFLERKEVDEAYLEKQLKKLKLWEFFSHTKDLISYWFYDGKADEAVLQMEKVLFSGGAYGTEEGRRLSTALKENLSGRHNSRKKLFFTRLFPSYCRMCILFPVLKKAPILLPFFWLWRIFFAAFFKKGTLSKQYHIISILSEENIKEYDKNLSLVGLEFRLDPEEE